MQKDIATIVKNAQEEIRVQLTEYRGYDLVDVRIWTKSLSGEENAPEKPTKKGLTVKLSVIPDLIAALSEALRIYNELKTG